MENLHRIWLEGVQVPWGRPTDQDHVRAVSDIPLPHQVRPVFLGWILYTIHLAGAEQQ